MRRNKTQVGLRILAIKEITAPQWYSSGIYLDDEKQQVARVKQLIAFRWPHEYRGPKGEKMACRDAREAVFQLHKFLKTGPFAGFEKDVPLAVGDVAVVDEFIVEADS